MNKDTIIIDWSVDEENKLVEISVTSDYDTQETTEFLLDLVICTLYKKFRMDKTHARRILYEHLNKEYDHVCE